MGEIADMAIDGECCQICFCDFRSPGLGYPFTCDECKADIRATSNKRRQHDRVPCRECGRMITHVGMAQHYEAVHKEVIYDDENDT